MAEIPVLVCVAGALAGKRIIIPDATGLLHYALRRMNGLVANLVVDTERMAENLASTRGLVYSQAVLLALIDRGMTRDEAYRIVQRNAMKTWDEGGMLKDHLSADPDMSLDAETLDTCFSFERFLGNAAVVFERLEAAEV
jgi:adenylosuccinate lyase